MRRAAVPLSILLTLAAATVLDAQIVGQRTYEPAPKRDLFLPDSRPPGPGIGREVAQLRENIRRARDGGRLSRRDARRLDREARRIAHAAARYGRDGLSVAERTELDARTAALRSLAGRP